MKITDYLKTNILYLDGGMGTLLQEKGLKPGEHPEVWNITHSDIITAIHKSYFDAGSNVVNTNTFGANILKFSEEELDQIIRSAIGNAKKAVADSNSCKEKWVALDIGPTGRMLKPYGDLDFEDAVQVFKKTIVLGEKYGADLIFIETMNDSYETKAAVLAAKESSNLPVFISNAYGDDGKLMTGASPAAMVAMLEGLNADAIGVNCSLGPKALFPVVEEYLKYASVPVILKPNAGLPKSIDGKTVFDLSAANFAEDVEKMLEKGVTIAGGCCGTTPEYIKALTEKTKDITPKPITKKEYTLVSSYTHAVEFGKKPILIGERINPTGKKRFKEALRNRDIDYILKEGITQAEKGVDILDVNVGLPEIDEVEMIETAVCELQAVVDLPLQVDTSNITAMETALRRYNGKAMINSVNGKEESMNAIFPLAKKYGGLVVALTLDENGIPKKGEDRLKIAEKILNVASQYGIDKKDIIFDPLAMTISAEADAAVETLKAVELITNTLGCKTSLGVSNVSFGLPQRDIVTANFFSLALSKGLSAAIMNPYSDEMMKTYFAFCALNGLDENCHNYIEFAENLPTFTADATPASKGPQTVAKTELQAAIIKGLKEKAASLTAEMLKFADPLEIVQQEVIPALDTVGTGFENKTVYLPGLLMSAEAAKSAFEQIKSVFKSDNTHSKATIVLATVKGDIHDIGKNIVKLLLENYGYNVVDLGKDVEPQVIADKTAELHAPLVGLSALMTTTVPAMEETIRLLKVKAPWCKTIVGGAVLTKSYADMLGADHYARDAMEAVRYAENMN